MKKEEAIVQLLNEREFIVARDLVEPRKFYDVNRNEHHFLFTREDQLYVCYHLNLEDGCHRMNNGYEMCDGCDMIEVMSAKKAEFQKELTRLESFFKEKELERKEAVKIYDEEVKNGEWAKVEVK